jgi:hypothetical protein
MPYCPRRRAADHHGDLGHLGGRDGRDELGAVLGDAARLVFRAHHEAGDVLQEEKRDLALAAQLDEVRALQGALREQDAVVGDNAHRHAVKARKAGDQRLAIELLELVKFRAVHQTRDHFAHVKGLRVSAGITPPSCLGSRRGSRGSSRNICLGLTVLSPATMRRAICRA